MNDRPGAASALPLAENEQIIFKTRQSAILLILQLVGLLIIALALFFFLLRIDGTAIFWIRIGVLVAPTLVALVRLLEYFTTLYTLTSHRVQTDFGILIRTSYAVPLTQIETLDLNRSMLGRILNYGDVTCRPTAATKLIIVFRTISNPTLRREQIEKQLP